MEGIINGRKEKERPRKTFIGEMIEIAGRDRYSRIRSGIIKEKRVKVYFRYVMA